MLSFGQDPLLAPLPRGADPRATAGRVLDVATGTGLVAERLLARGHTVVGLDQSAGDARGRADAAAEAGWSSWRHRAEALPFADGEFDHLTFTYLLRYVDDPGATLRELARVVRPGGTIAMLEFAVPRGVWRPLWNAYCAVGLPAAGRLVSPGWRDVGRFLGPSIRDFHARYPEAALDDALAPGGDRRASRPRGGASAAPS